MQHGTKDDLKNIKLDTESKFITDILITEQSTGDIIIAGFYSNKKQTRGTTFTSAVNSSDGVFLVKIDANGTPVNYGKGYYEFPAEALKQFMSERAQKKLEKKEDKGELEAKDLVMRKVISNADGSMEILGEEYKVVTTTSYNGRSTTTYTNYYYDDILDMRIDAKGEMVWTKKVPKRQVGSSGRGSMSFYAYTQNNCTYLFYTDNIKNLKLSLDKEPASHSDGLGGYLVYYKIDASGNITKGDLFDYKKEGIRFQPANFERLGSKSIVNRAYKGKQSRVVVISQK